MTGRWIAGLALALALAAPPASAAVVDLDYLFDSGSGAGNGTGGLSVQTFRPTLGGRLTRLDLQLYAGGIDPGNSGVQVSIVASTGGTPDITLDPATDTVTKSTLASVSRAPIAVGAGLDGFDVQAGAFSSFDFLAQNVQLTAGALYAIVVEQTDSVHGNLFWGYDPAGGYAGGQAGSLTFAANVTGPSYGATDFSFRTYMAPAQVPVPAAGWLLLAPLAGCGAAAWRRHRRKAG